MPGTTDVTAQWPNARYLEHHFRRHGRPLRVRTEEDYDRSAQATIRTGRRFTYRDRLTDEQRVGYHDQRTRRFTALTADERTIRSHYRTDDGNYPRHLLDSTY